MGNPALDPSILQDFLTESGELLERLEGDLVTLERDPRDPEMLNQIFRALHTIKGSASFLALTNLVRIAHASESALNAARNRVVVVDRGVMDLLLSAVDVLKRQMQQLRDGQDLVEPPAELVSSLTAIGDGRWKSSAPASAAVPSEPTNKGGDLASHERPLQLPSSKQDLLEFLVSDLEETILKLRERLEGLRSANTRADASGDLVETSVALVRAVEFFELDRTTAMAKALSESMQALANADDATVEAALPRCGAVLELLNRQVGCLKRSVVGEWSTEALVERLTASARGNSGVPRAGSVAEALRIDGVDTGEPNAAEVSAEPAAMADHPVKPGVESSKSTEERAAEGPRKSGPAGDQTIRVEVGRLETLMNLVGELVLQKNRVASLARTISACEVEQALREALSTAAGGLDRVTSDIQMAVMRTRMQPLDKLFGRYPRLIRDLCGKTGKKIDLVIEGGETEVDKSVIEELNDPLVHLLRNSADHGIEMPADRVKGGKPETGVITLSAMHEGSHVRIRIRDDGKGLSRERIAKKAIERGLVSADAVASLSDREVYDFIFLPGFSTAEQVSDLSGRGVGMDVVRTNVQKIKGTIELSSVPGSGTTIDITIPLTVAIMPAMMVAVAEEVYAIPLSSILEIVRPAPETLSSIGGRKVMRLRDSVLPLVSASEIFGLNGGGEVDSPFAVVLAQGGRRVGLMVTRPVGQQEIVVKPLDVASGHGKKAVSGATVRDDGGVSLIADVAELFQLAEFGVSGADQTA